MKPADKTSKVAAGSTVIRDEDSVCVVTDDGITIATDGEMVALTKGDVGFVVYLQDIQAVFDEWYNVNL